jgi:hypothetical protein
MKIVVLSFFRNSAHGQLQRFMRQVADLRAALAPRYDVGLVAVYGDCTDNTGELLEAFCDALRIPATIVRCDHGGPVYGSTEQPERMRDLSKIANKGLDYVVSMTGPADYFVWYVESDLIWKPETVARLVMRLENEPVAAVAPLIFAGPHFYDVYSFRGLDGSRFAPFAPYHQTLLPEYMTEVSSVGSAFLMKGYVAQHVRIKNDGALPGFWEEARRLGYHVYVDPMERVEHPA